MRTDKLTRVSRALSLVGFAIASYLTTVYLEDVPPACFGGSSGCVTVQHSSYAHLAGIPLPLRTNTDHTAAADLVAPNVRKRLSAALLWAPR